MKQGFDSAAVGRAPESEEFVSRKLIRPLLSRAERPEAPSGAQPPAPEKPNGTSISAGGPSGTAAAERPARDRRPERTANGKHFQPSEQTHAENFYYQKQMQAKTLLTIVLRNGETVQGTIEWYDKNSIKINRSGKSNLLIYKPSIRYLHKSED